MCVIWGIPYFLILIAVRDLSPAVLVLGRTSIAALLLLPIAAARGELRPLRGHWVPLLVFAAIEIAIPSSELDRARARSRRGRGDRRAEPRRGRRAAALGGRAR